jgi:hypothetical protein
MMKAEVSGNAIEIVAPRSEVLLLGISAVLLGALLGFAGWQVAFVTLGVSLMGAGVVDLVQRADVRIFGR